MHNKEYIKKIINYFEQNLNDLKDSNLVHIYSMTIEVFNYMLTYEITVPFNEEIKKKALMCRDYFENIITNETEKINSAIQKEYFFLSVMFLSYFEERPYLTSLTCNAYSENDLSSNLNKKNKKQAKYRNHYNSNNYKYNKK